MTKMLLLLGLMTFTFVACDHHNSQQTKTQPQSKHEMSCESVGGYILRCENEEVVCYTKDNKVNTSMDSQSGISCIPKNNK